MKGFIPVTEIRKKKKHNRKQSSKTPNHLFCWRLTVGTVGNGEKKANGVKEIHPIYFYSPRLPIRPFVLLVAFILWASDFFT